MVELKIVDLRKNDELRIQYDVGAREMSREVRRRGDGPKKLRESENGVEREIEHLATGQRERREEPGAEKDECAGDAVDDYARENGAGRNPKDLLGRSRRVVLLEATLSDYSDFVDVPTSFRSTSRCSVWVVEASLKR